MVHSYSSTQNPTEIDKHILSFIQKRFDVHIFRIYVSIIITYQYSDVQYFVCLFFSLLLELRLGFSMQHSFSLDIQPHFFPFYFSLSFSRRLLCLGVCCSRIQLYSSRIFQSFLARRFFPVLFGNALVLYQPNNSFQCFSCARFICERRQRRV